MNTLDKRLWSDHKITSQLWKAQRLTLFILLLSGFWISCAEANLNVLSITQTPTNPTVGESITYEVTVTYSDPNAFRSIAESDVAFTGGGGDETAAITIINTQSDNLNITSYFSSTDCTFDQSFSCNSTSNLATFRFTWTPPLSGTYNMRLNLACLPDCSGDSMAFSTIVAPQKPIADAGIDRNIIDENNDGSEVVSLDASGTVDPFQNIANFQWYEGSNYLGSGETLTVDLELGTHLITLEAWDGSDGADVPISTDNVTITVQKPTSSNSEPGIVILSGANQRLSEGSTSDPLSIRAIGPDGQPLEGVTVTWTVIPTDAATITNDTSTTDTNGESSNIVTLATSRIPGTFQVRAALPSGTSARFQVNPLAGISGLTAAQRSVANALDNACPSLQQLINNQEGGTTQQESLLDTCNDLASASDQEIISALQQFLPVEIAAQGRNSISLARIRNKNILLRLDALRSGASGPSFENISVSIQGEQLPSIVISELTKSKKGGAASADSIASPLGVFVNGNISIGDTETTENEAGFDFETNGLTMGVDYRYSDQFVLGGALNYISTNSDYLSRSSTLDIDGYSLSLYGSYYQSEQVFIDSILSIGLNNYDSQREFTTGGINHDLKGDTDGAEYAFSLGGGYEFNYQNLSFVPQARVNYLRIKVDSYDETSSGSGLNLSIDDQDIESLITSISGNLSLAYSTQYGVFIPYLSIEWAHEFENDSRAIIAHFVNDPTKTNFSVLTDDPDQDYFFLGLGVSAAMANGKSAFLHYEQMLDHADTSQYTVTAGFRLEF